jgi:hypothetical protein
MARVVWACPACWTELGRRGAQLLSLAPGQGACVCCRANLRPDQRAARFLLTDPRPVGRPQ